MYVAAIMHDEGQPNAMANEAHAVGFLRECREYEKPQLFVFVFGVGLQSVGSRGNKSCQSARHTV